MHLYISLEIPNTIIPIPNQSIRIAEFFADIRERHEIKEVKKWYIVSKKAVCARIVGVLSLSSCPRSKPPPAVVHAKDTARGNHPVEIESHACNLQHRSVEDLFVA